jgi:hypothetical protein
MQLGYRGVLIGQDYIFINSYDFSRAGLISNKINSDFLGFG